MKVLGKNSLCTLLNNEDLSFAYPGKWFKDWYGFDEDFYLVEREDSLKTLIWKKDGSFVNENLWFKNWFNNFDFKNSEIILVERDDGLSTLIHKSDGTYLFKDLWFKIWFDVNKKYFQVYTTDNKTTFIKKSDGSLLFDLVPKENLRKPSFHSPNVFICKDGNLTEFIL